MIMRVNCMKNNAGISLMGAIIVVVVVSFLGVVASALLVSKMGASSLRLSSIKAQFVAEGGIERGVQQYKANCSGYTGESNVALGQGRFTVQVYATDFDGVTALALSKRRILSTGYVPSATNPVAVKVVQQIATCPASVSYAVASKAALDLWNGSTITCGAQVCGQNEVQNGSCTCAKKNSAATYPAVTVPGGLSAPPGGLCQYNGGTFFWSAGTYYCPQLQLNSGSIINLTGAVTIYVGLIELNNISQLNWSGQAANLLVMVAGSGYTALNSGSFFKGFIYVPGSTNVQLNNSSQVMGAIVTGNMAINSGSDVVWDQTAGSATPGFIGTGSGGGGSDTTIDWREPPLQ
jgi:hypothetical protein